MGTCVPRVKRPREDGVRGSSSPTSEGVGRVGRGARRPEGERAGPEKERLKCLRADTGISWLGGEDI
jgi:hypothetical protein